MASRGPVCTPGSKFCNRAENRCMAPRRRSRAFARTRSDRTGSTCFERPARTGCVSGFGDRSGPPTRVVHLGRRTPGLPSRRRLCRRSRRCPAFAFGERSSAEDDDDRGGRRQRSRTVSEDWKRERRRFANGRVLRRHHLLRIAGVTPAPRWRWGHSRRATPCLPTCPRRCGRAASRCAARGRRPPRGTPRRRRAP
jgi:hypothetical protein